ncbi:MAG TPA: hypothetical protein VMZ26_18055, partial [Pyrinomonadaceae bacterium]|nr:hypothetical protein [Pyrinomonadaceae bacterium]
MFDKLIESDSMGGAEFKPRRTFFLVSFVVVGIVFLSALVFDLYAANIDLGTDNFELSELLAPIVPDAPEPERPRQQPLQRNAQQTNILPIRNQMIADIDHPTQTPPQISTTRSTGMTLPPGRFILDRNGVESNGSGTPAGPAGNTVAGGSSADPEPRPVETAETREPPPPAKAESKRPTIKS